ncbi:hypothetical protein SSX86_024741 [Deinandra increscens subsp. villosa]|uniref:Uncharacterized protein n=1 Tax=Deinandra increscens subsp. villosa TaxID=3103831 RepID=A0AAP0GMB5_9ASTR
MVTLIVLYSRLKHRCLNPKVDQQLKLSERPKNYYQKIPPKKIPRTIENTREADETVCKPGDEELFAGNGADEFSSVLNGDCVPKVLMTTSRFHSTVEGPTLIKDLLTVIPNTQHYKRGTYELKKLSGVQCAGNPHFWVNDHGSYQEGQKNTRGYIWGKAGTKLVCAVLSLPVPSKTIYPAGEKLSNNTLGQSVSDYFDQLSPRKLLLIGCCRSGTSTMFKQEEFLKCVGFYKEAKCKRACVRNMR